MSPELTLHLAFLPPTPAHPHPIFSPETTMHEDMKEYDMKEYVERETHPLPTQLPQPSTPDQKVELLDHQGHLDKECK